MKDAFQRLAFFISDVVGTHRAFLVALGAVVVWAATGPLFGFSDSWQLVVNTGTTVVTFLMVFLIQATQNRETRALHLKIDELIRAQRRARNIFADLEHATEQELTELEAEFRKVRARATAREQAKQAGGAAGSPH
ncbi:low affinity iron permease family protein [Anaeromyxobacter sp. Red801]|uniref:low affinity iron permease family protein n=1 Tax=Anaeromyxobacter sp. Red801 TaxID=3411632 RepID=UPI003BA36312